jgi:HD domain
MDTELIDTILSSYKKDLGLHFEKYHNHACRVYIFATILSNANEDEQKQIAIAAAFHDLGIWSANTFDYLNPSVKLAEEYLIQNHLEHWINNVKEIINHHHKLTPYKHNQLAENFRKADLIDLTFGLIKFGINATQITKYKKRYPAKGFQIFIFKEIIKNIIRHPLNPLPIVKW